MKNISGLALTVCLSTAAFAGESISDFRGALLGCSENVSYGAESTWVCAKKNSAEVGYCSENRPQAKCQKADVTAGLAILENMRESATLSTLSRSRLRTLAALLSVSDITSIKARSELGVGYQLSPFDMEGSHDNLFQELLGNKQMTIPSEVDLDFYDRFVVPALELAFIMKINMPRIQMENIPLNFCYDQYHIDRLEDSDTKSVAELALKRIPSIEQRLDAMKNTRMGRGPKKIEFCDQDYTYQLGDGEVVHRVNVLERRRSKRNSGSHLDLLRR